MTGTARLEFGFNPPQTLAGIPAMSSNEYLPALGRKLDIATQGFTSFWFGDHLDAKGAYMMESWTFLAWLASRYPGVKLGTIAMCNLFRNPSVVAKMGATLQELSSGRFVLGYGAGGPINEPERIQYGLRSPGPRTRIEMMDEAIQVIRALWTQPSASFDGTYYKLEGASCEPRPTPVPPVQIGGVGEKYTLWVVARQADWWNLPHDRLTEADHKLAVLQQHCDREGRDLDTIRKTFTAVVYIDRDNATAVEAGKEMAGKGMPQIAGDAQAVRDQLTDLAEKGFSLAMLWFPRFPENDDVRLFMDEVTPHFA